MAKYSEEFKIHVVNKYMKGPLGYKLLAKKHDIPNHSQIKRWVRAFKEFGEVGLRRKVTKKAYSVQFKLDVLHFMKQTGASYQDTAIEFNMNNPGLIANWNSKFLKEGIEGLQEKAKGRPPMSTNPKNKPVKQPNTLSREEQLERENELLRLEIAYLKKLDAFEANLDAFLEKHKQRWHSNSKKKGSD
ncbi:helix-turn-helix domain-containing protein [Lysinibacillus sp. FSL K6-1151]|uniref:helix-turn-helix domain-containing protein n=1 Tax=Lysinibacillus sp. FSL K6-1151 TaxID=2921465 RepID=UPI00315AA8F9